MRAEVARGLAEPAVGHMVVEWEMPREYFFEGGGALSVLGGNLPDQEFAGWLRCCSSQALRALGNEGG